MIGWLSGRLVGEGHKAPKFHAAGHPKLAESEATGRAIELSELVDSPLYVVHVSSKEAAEEIAAAGGAGSRCLPRPVRSTCCLTAEDLDKPGMEGAKFCCSPGAPGRGVPGGALGGNRPTGPSDVVEFGPRALQLRRPGEAGRGPGAALPEDLQRGAGGRAADAAALLGRRRQGADQSSNASSPSAARRRRGSSAAIRRKGTIAPGSDADLAIWNPDQVVDIRWADLHDHVGYSPYEGPPDQGISGDRAPARRGGGSGRPAAGPGGKRPVHRPRPAGRGRPRSDALPGRWRWPAASGRRTS